MGAVLRPGGSQSERELSSVCQAGKSSVLITGALVAEETRVVGIKATCATGQHGPALTPAESSWCMIDRCLEGDSDS